jgi:hypothetical protein
MGGGPWTDDEERDYQDFLASLGAPVEDPELAAFLAPDAGGEFFDLVYEVPEIAVCWPGFAVFQ